jgi:peptidoglycan/LPS O-acetylase OafA/YrhL
VINNIQILRALAVLMVIAYHSSGLIYKYGFEFDGFLNIGHWGAFGVDVFFVISGYIMAQIDSVKKKSSIEFIKDRVVRVIPVYWMFTFLMITMQFFYPDAFRYIIFSKEQNISSVFFISHLLGFSYPTIYVGWSLELEMVFYAFFSLCIFIESRKVKIPVLILTIFVMTIIGIIRPMAVEFLFGVILYYVVKFLNIENKARAILFFPITVSLVSIFSISNASSDIFSWSRPLTIGLVALAIVAFSVICMDFRKSIITYIGDASYSLYLIQVFSLPIIMKAASKIVHEIDGGYIFVASILFTIFSGIAFHECVEKKIIKVMKKRS